MTEKEKLQRQLREAKVNLDNSYTELFKSTTSANRGNQLKKNIKQLTGLIKSLGEQLNKIDAE